MRRGVKQPGGRVASNARETAADANQDLLAPGIEKLHRLLPAEAARADWCAPIAGFLGLHQRTRMALRFRGAPLEEVSLPARRQRWHVHCALKQIGT